MSKCHCGQPIMTEGANECNKCIQISREWGQISHADLEPSTNEENKKVIALHLHLTEEK